MDTTGFREKNEPTVKYLCFLQYGINTCLKTVPVANIISLSKY